MKRINNASKYLKNIVEVGQEYHIGFGNKELTDLAQSNQGMIDLIRGSKNAVIITGKKGALRENTQGKFVRKQPEAKITVVKHIEYYSYKHSKLISYDREFSVWEKELLHQFKLELKMGKSPQGETIFYFPKFIMEDTNAHYLKAGAAMNMAIALGSYSLLYDPKLEPILPITKYKDVSLLPAGNYSLIEKIDIIEKNIPSLQNNDTVGNSYRFAVLKDQAPTDVTMGIGGFNEYLMFEYAHQDLIIFENLKSNNATYIFRHSDFDTTRYLDKQVAPKDPAFIKRVVHENMQTWNTQIGRYFS